MNTVGKRLKALRASIGNPPQPDVAERVGVSLRSLSSWESDSARPGHASAVKLAAFYETTPEWILFGASASADRRFDAIEARLDQILKLLKGGQ